MERAQPMSEGSPPPRRRAADPVVSAAQAWRAGYNLHLHGRYDAALEEFARADLGSATAGDRATLWAVRAASLWALGDAVEARSLADRAREAALACGDPLACAFAWIS